ncbi:hypothetical protein [Streptomyces aureoverticillatus]|uniref:hypothetical protein n=1 Tax=Streptomyces aureoverticillatus TaxID=66871 RepID=UPI0013DBAF8F|nr:hypothetical protein [Streptomyces aureoverticillatus]QIB49533.1 hypothetical protein G3H79_40915 [Streptomyces aureoverticillatus]
MSAVYRRRWTRAGTVAALIVLLLAVSSTPSFADDGGGSSGDLLSPLDVTTSEGVPISRYELTATEDGPIDTVMKFILSGTFALARTVVGFASWLVDWAYRFPVLEKLAGPAQKISDAYETNVLGPLGMAGAFLAWTFTFGLIMIMRGRVARGAGEILLTLLIATFAASTLLRPSMLLGHDGPIQQTQRAALEAASITANGGDKSKGASPCDLLAGPAQSTCRRTDSDSGASAAEKAKQRKQACDAVAGPAHDTCLRGERPLAAADVSKPITRTLTDTLVVQPFMLLQYGRSIDKDSPLYKAHKDLIKPPKNDGDDPCGRIKGPAKKYCQQGEEKHGAQREFDKLGEDGEAAADYMQSVTWERLLGALLVLIVAAIIAIVIMAMVLALFVAQFGCVIAAACAGVVFAWAMLPGPNRAALWKWVGYYASACVVLFGVAVFIPLFGVAARALLADNATPMMERLLTLVGLAVTALAAHRIMLRKGNNLGRRFAERMRYARIGGSHTMGDNAAATASAMASLGYSGAGSSPAHQSLLSRHAGLSLGLRALGDPVGLPGHPGAFLAEARAEGRRALAPLALGARAAHAALIGPPRTAHQPTRPGAKHPAPGAEDPATPTVIDGRTGRIISRGTPPPDFTPFGTRLEAGLKRTRGGRALVGTTKAAYYSTVGLPATWTRARRATSTLTGDLHQELGHQRAHYADTATQWAFDTYDGLRGHTTRGHRPDEAAPTPTPLFAPTTRSESYGERDFGESGYGDDAYSTPPIVSEPRTDPVRPSSSRDRSDDLDAAIAWLHARDEEPPRRDRAASTDDSGRAMPPLNFRRPRPDEDEGEGR